MKKIEPSFKNSFKGYFSIVAPDGTLKCSCGRQLIKLDDNTYKCSGGYPIYRFEQGEFFIDKFGNLMFKEKDHNKEKKNDK